MRFKILSIIAAALVLAACESAQLADSDAGGTGVVQGGPVVGTPLDAGPLPGTQSDLVANVGDRVFFEFDRYELKPESRATIERWVTWLDANPQVGVVVEGHADERGTREYNLGLGERRANTAAEYMVALGVDPARISTVTFGKERPAVLGSNNAAYAQNRRGVMVAN